MINGRIKIAKIIIYVKLWLFALPFFFFFFYVNWGALNALIKLRYIITSLNIYLGEVTNVRINLNLSRINKRILLVFLVLADSVGVELFMFLLNIMFL